MATPGPSLQHTLKPQLPQAQNQAVNQVRLSSKFIGDGCEAAHEMMI